MPTHTKTMIQFQSDTQVTTFVCDCKNLLSFSQLSIFNDTGFWKYGVGVRGKSRIEGVGYISTSLFPSLTSPVPPPLSHLFPLPSSLPLEVGPLNTSRSLEEYYTLQQKSQIWCILALKSDIYLSVVVRPTPTLPSMQIWTTYEPTFSKKRRWSISVLPGYSGYTRGAHELLLTHSHCEDILLIQQIWMGKASMTDAEPPENDSILTTETTQITTAEERFDRV